MSKQIRVYHSVYIVIKRLQIINQKPLCNEFRSQIYTILNDDYSLFKRYTLFVANYRPQFYFRTTDVTGIVKDLGGAEMVMPGDHVEMTVELIAPIAIEEGTKFSIREGGRTVGSGSVTKIIK